MSRCPARGSLNHGLLRALFSGRGPVCVSVSCRSRHTFCALSAEDCKVPRPRDPSWPSSSYPVNHHRLSWDVRLRRRTWEETRATQPRPLFSAHGPAAAQYVPHAQALLSGLWALDRDPVWTLVDDVAATGATGAPRGSAGGAPEFERWRHVVVERGLSDATLTLVAQGYLRYRSPLDDRDDGIVDEEDEDEEVVVDDHPEPHIPTWVVAYMLATMTRTRAEAYEGLAFCISQLDATPKHLRAPLLLLSLCSLATHNVIVHVPILLTSFIDVFSNNTPGSETAHTPPLGSQESIIYQYNVLLTLLSQFPQAPGLARRAIQFLQHMQAAGVPLDVDTAKKLTASRFASNLLVATVRDVLERQGIHDVQEDSDDLSFALMRFYAKRSNQAEASKYVEPSLRVRPGEHAQSYIRSFRDAADAFAYLKTIETKTGDKGDVDGLNHPDRSQSVQGPTLSAPPAPRFRGITKRHVYTSLLHSAAISKTISAETFRALFMTIRENYGDDRELETVALSGMLRRNAWEEAKDLWEQWQTTNRSIRAILREMRAFLDRREKTFGDAGRVRRTLGWSRLTEKVTCRRMNMLSVDANALSVVVRALAGPKPESLAGAFATMDEYAIKMQKSGGALGSAGAGAAGGAERVGEQVQLTSRVVNCFMVRAMYFRRPDVVFRLWDGMTGYYGVDCSTSTLDILIRSARLAASMETALTRVTPKWMKLPGGFFVGGRRVFAAGLGAEVLWMLGPGCSPSPRWGGVPAWRMVRYLFREEILFANWPWLRGVDVPARAVRGDDATGQVEALRELRLHGGLWGTPIRQMGNYPHLMLNARIFREYIIMLGRVHRSSEIPEVLAWMKALGILPSRRALSHALALWSQVGLEALPDDAWGGGVESKHPGRAQQNECSSSSHVEARHGGEYKRLLAWLEDWLGKENMPEESEVLMSFTYIQQLHEREARLY